MLTKLNPLLLLVAATALAAPAHAQTQKVLSSATGVVASAECTENTQSSTVGTVAGGVGGGAVGGVVGGAIGSALFGKTGRNLGAALGAAGGAMAGSNLASTTTYQCLLEVKSDTELLLAQVEADRKPQVGQRVKILTLDNGTQRVMRVN